jgi:hypothetical protein
MMRRVLLLLCVILEAPSANTLAYGVAPSGGETHVQLTPPKLNATEASQANHVELKGRVVPAANSTNLQFRVDDGPSHKLLPSRDAKALFADTNLHTKVLLLKGRIHSKESAFEVIGNLNEVRDGKIYELYYYCDICSIETSFPGPCLCCREDVVLRERERKK